MKNASSKPGVKEITRKMRADSENEENYVSNFAYFLRFPNDVMH